MQKPQLTVWFLGTTPDAHHEWPPLWLSESPLWRYRFVSLWETLQKDSLGKFPPPPPVGLILLLDSIGPALSSWLRLISWLKVPKVLALWSDNITEGQETLDQRERDARLLLSESGLPGDEAFFLRLSEIVEEGSTR